MHTSTHILNERSYTLLPDEGDITALPLKNRLHALPEQAIITVEGANARTFLQGQLSADIRTVSATHAQPAALCSLKGRILALMTVIEWKGLLHLVLPVDNADTVLETLARVAALSRVKLVRNTEMAVFGLVQVDTTDALPPLPTTPWEVQSTEGVCACALGGDNFLILTLPAEAHRLQENLAAAGSLSWHYRQLLNGRFTIYPVSRDVFLPHRLGLHKGPHLSFDKGCYRGQEVIARMHYKSTTHHHLERFTCSSAGALTAGERLLDVESGREWGEVVDTCPNGASGSLLVLASLREGHPLVLRAENHSEPLHISLLATSV